MMAERDVKGKVQEALARSAMYRILALGFSPPGPEVLDFCKGGFARNLLEVVSLLPGDGPRELVAAVEELSETPSSLEEIEGEYNRLFRTALACTPYETEYDPMRSARKGQVLADVLAFYTAFALRPADEARELPDHLGMELEFMSLLLQKEAYAMLNDWSDKTDVCTDAQRTFLSDHLGTWVFAFCDRLEQTARVAFYRALARLLRKFMEDEIRSCGLEPLKTPGVSFPSEEEIVSCPFSRCAPE
jgi:DMSO reductase family type II enzyme chaperone